MYINEKLNKFKEEIKGKKVAIIGMGVSNIPLIGYLYELGAILTVFDKRTEDKLDATKYNEYKNLGIAFSLGADYLQSLNGFDYIFRSPSMRFDVPEVAAEVARGAILTSEIEMLLKLCPGKIIGITGSDGKTTTTTLTYKILCEEGYHCYLGGNIGIPLFSKIDEMKPEDIIVLELSSFQLLTCKDSPSISAVTNVTPNHLDIHHGYEEYIAAKQNIYLNQDEHGIVVLNYDNDITRKFADSAKGEVRFFSTHKELENGVILKDEKDIFICKDGKEDLVISKDEILLIGRHNLENCCTVIALIKDLVSKESIRKVLTTFKGVEHRNELVRVVNGVTWRNDSIGSSPTRTIAGLLSFKDKVILISGGYDKHLDYTEMGDYVVKHAKALILLGQTAEKIKVATIASMEKNGISKEELPIYECTSLEETVNKANEIAKDGDNVFFSPASASFDMFKNFEERGNKFKELVNKL